MSVLPRHIFFALDFDQTITTQDTTSAIADFASRFQLSKGFDLATTWSEIASRYEQEHANHVEKYSSALEKAVFVDGVIAYSRSFKEVELGSFERVSSSGIFKDITMSEWEEWGREAIRNGKISVRPGFPEFVEKLKQLNRTLGIVSVNFVGAFVRGVLEESLEFHDFQVFANQPDKNGIIGGPGNSEVIATSDAKLIWMKQYFKTVDPKGSATRFYVGDSLTDIECLMDPTITGVILSEHGDGKLILTLRKASVEVVHIAEYPRRSTSTYWARNFHEMTSVVPLGEG